MRIGAVRGFPLKGSFTALRSADRTGVRRNIRGETHRPKSGTAILISLRGLRGHSVLIRRELAVGECMSWLETVGNGLIPHLGVVQVLRGTLEAMRMTGTSSFTACRACSNAPSRFPPLFL